MHQRAYDIVQEMLAKGDPTEETMYGVYEILTRYRCLLLNNTIVQKEGSHVLGGPFAGMALVNPMNGFNTPLLLGCYEEELHDIVRSLPATAYQHVLNIGCGDGYYAVGLKRLMPSVEMWAYDIDPEAQRKCRDMAALNGVDIHAGGPFDPGDFANHAGHRTLVWCDIEGAEAALLDPVSFPALVGMDILVETHPTDQGHTIHTVPGRFAETHIVEIHHPRGHIASGMPGWLREGDQINLLLAQFEWRGAATPWAMMRSRALDRCCTVSSG